MLVMEQPQVVLLSMFGTASSVDLMEVEGRLALYDKFEAVGRGDD